MLNELLLRLELVRIPYCYDVLQRGGTVERVGGEMGAGFVRKRDGGGGKEGWGGGGSDTSESP